MSNSIFRGVSHRFSRFLSDESGNATIDWVGLVAGLVALSIAVMISIGGGVEVLADKMESELETRELPTY